MYPTAQLRLCNACNGCWCFPGAKFVSELNCRGPVAGLVKQEFVESILIKKQISVNNRINAYAGAQIEPQW